MSTPTSESVPYVSCPVPPEIGAPEPLGRNAARTLVQAQGHTWAALGATQAVVGHAENRDTLDASGDVLRAQIWGLLRQIKATARRAGQGAIYDLACTALGLAVRYEELDGHEDWHTARMAAGGATAVQHLGATARIHGGLLSATGLPPAAGLVHERPVAGDHRCQARLAERCRGCGTLTTWCTATVATVAEIMRQPYRCPACRLAVG